MGCNIDNLIISEIPQQSQFNNVIKDVIEKSINGKNVINNISNNWFFIKEISYSGKDFKFNNSGNIGKENKNYKYNYKITYAPHNFPNINLVATFN